MMSKTVKIKIMKTSSQSTVYKYQEMLLFCGFEDEPAQGVFLELVFLQLHIYSLYYS